MNPSEYAGRQVFSPALLNRFRVKWIDEPDLDDAKKILKDKYPGMNSSVLNKAAEVHYKLIDIIRKAKNPAEGTEGEDIGSAASTTAYYTIRHLLRWMDRLGAVSF